MFPASFKVGTTSANLSDLADACIRKPSRSGLLHLDGLFRNGVVLKYNVGLSLRRICSISTVRISSPLSTPTPAANRTSLRPMWTCRAHGEL